MEHVQSDEVEDIVISIAEAVKFADVAEGVNLCSDPTLNGHKADRSSKIAPVVCETLFRNLGQNIKSLKVSLHCLKLLRQLLLQNNNIVGDIDVCDGGRILKDVLSSWPRDGEIVAYCLDILNDFVVPSLCGISYSEDLLETIVRAIEQHLASKPIFLSGFRLYLQLFPPLVSHLPVKDELFELLVQHTIYGMKEYRKDVELSLMCLSVLAHTVTKLSPHYTAKYCDNAVAVVSNTFLTHRQFPEVVAFCVIILDKIAVIDSHLEFYGTYEVLLEVCDALPSLRDLRDHQTVNVWGLSALIAALHLLIKAVVEVSEIVRMPEDQRERAGHFVRYLHSSLIRYGLLRKVTSSVCASDAEEDDSGNDGDMVSASDRNDRNEERNDRNEERKVLALAEDLRVELMRVGKGFLESTDGSYNLLQWLYDS